MHKLFTPLRSGVKGVITFYINQRIKYLESSREKWKIKAMNRLSRIHDLEQRLERTEMELKKIDDQP